jgi:hypothetical protein
MANQWDGYKQMEKWKEGIDLEASDKDDILDYLNTRLF